MVNSVKVSHHATYSEYLDSMKALILSLFRHFHSCLVIEEEVKRRKGKKKRCLLPESSYCRPEIPVTSSFQSLLGSASASMEIGKRKPFLYRMQTCWFKLCATSSSAKSFNYDNSLTGASAVSSKKQAWLYLLPLKGRQLRACKVSVRDL